MKISGIKIEKGIMFMLTAFIVTALLILAIALYYRFGWSNSNPSANYAGAVSAEESDYATQLLTNPGTEVRGVYIATVSNLNFPSKSGLGKDELSAEIDDIILTSLAAGINTIYFQVRPCGDALYKSEIFPTSSFLVENQGDELVDNFDPLEYFVEKAHENGIELHAWINPYRVTDGSVNDLSELSENNPARLHPEWVKLYADNKFYYDPGIPEVRELIFSGVTELVKNYDIDGVIIDDYFYPYPKDNADFDDAQTYYAYGAGMDKDDWRRQNVNNTVKGIYDAVKSVRNSCEFGVAPFGIWRNDDGENGGSATNGLDAYDVIYCDALAWAKGGYVDYLAPQIYWDFTTEAARYDELVRWWNANLSPYPDVKLLISHAAYRVEAFDENEISNQIEFARQESKYYGSIFYGYAAIKDNLKDLSAELSEIYSEPIVYTDIVSDNYGVKIQSPTDGYYVNDTHTYLLGKCDPAYPLYFNGRPVSFTKSGYFNVYTELEDGENVFVFVQNGVEYKHTVIKGENKSSSVTTSYKTLDEYAIVDYSLENERAFYSGENFNITLTAPSGCEVSAEFCGKTIKMSPTINPPSDSKYMKEVYTASIKLDGSYSKDGITNLGSIKYTVNGSEGTLTATSGNIYAVGDNATFSVEVIKDDTELKIETDSWYYDDYSPTTVGMTDTVDEIEGNYYRLRMGGYVSCDNTKIVNAEISLATLGTPFIKVSSKYTYLYIPTDIKIPANGYINGNDFIFTLYNVKVASATDICGDITNPIFTSATLSTKAEKNKVVYTLHFKNNENYYGFDYKYEDGYIVLSLRNPSILKSGIFPLAGKTIVLDAGHGGTETGAPGPDSVYHEADTNLSMVLCAKEKLEALGATVILTRSENVNVPLMDRVNYIDELEPDLCISVHQNSISYGADPSNFHGVLGLFYAYSGYMLVNSVSTEVAQSMNRILYDVKGQRLAMTRNEEFPCCLIEFGYTTTPEESEQSLVGNGVELAAQGIADGIISYYENQSKYYYTVVDGKLQSFNYTDNIGSVNGSFIKHIFNLITFN